MKMRYLISPLAVLIWLSPNMSAIFSSFDPVTGEPAPGLIERFTAIPPEKGGGPRYLEQLGSLSETGFTQASCTIRPFSVSSPTAAQVLAVDGLPLIRKDIFDGVDSKLVNSKYTVGPVHQMGDVQFYEIYVGKKGTTRNTLDEKNSNLSFHATLLKNGQIIQAFALASDTLLLAQARGSSLDSGAKGTGGKLDPKIELHDMNTKLVGSNDNWDADVIEATKIKAAAIKVAAPPLAAQSKDAAVLLTLPAGRYTFQVNAVGDTSGEVNIELFEVPAR